MILLALAKTGRILDYSNINTQCTTIIFIRLLPSTTLLPRGETLLRFPITNIQKYSKTFHQQPENIRRLFINNSKIFKDFSSTTRKYSKTFSPAELSEPQTINIPEILKDFPASKQYPSSKQQPVFQPQPAII